MTTCTIPGCDGTHHARGMCLAHYMAWYHHGDPQHPRSRGVQREQRTERRTTMSGASDDGIYALFGALVRVAIQDALHGREDAIRWLEGSTVWEIAQARRKGRRR